MYYGRFYRRSRSVNRQSTSTTSLLFDVNDPNTMTRPKDVSTKWSKSTVDVARSSRYGVVTVYDNNYGATSVLKESKTRLTSVLPKVNGSWDVHTHCEWCGQALDYVAIIVGINDKNESTVSHIGCDCVGKIFGINWFGYRNADNAKKVLVEAAKSRRRAEEYPVKYAKELLWLKSVPEFLRNKHQFLNDMIEIIEKGSRPISKKMENYLKSYMSRKEFDPKTFASAKLEIDKTLEKLTMILRLVESVDTTEDARSKPWSAYSFVRSIKERFEMYHSPLTAKQMEGLNKVYTRYKGFTKKSIENKMKGDANEIPW